MKLPWSKVFLLYFEKCPIFVVTYGILFALRIPFGKHCAPCLFGDSQCHDYFCESSEELESSKESAKGKASLS